ncbi:hypothetical protein A200_07709 [Parascardovia denticolens IPLA 20019]|uniref:hypothetical protein n=1 Tax=Parascardovia denticolens TaxID=78258 RepID=UPI0002669E39|nr:hypothetical protein [Parascardovia denticolens]EIT87550.1 hypothetical protein A200_07709 [Parascardovia denticolens IPLA 20019]
MRRFFHALSRWYFNYRHLMWLLSLMTSIGVPAATFLLSLFRQRERISDMVADNPERAATLTYSPSQLVHAIPQWVVVLAGVASVAGILALLVCLIASHGGKDGGKQKPQPEPESSSDKVDDYGQNE